MTKFYSTTTQVKTTLSRGPLLFNFFLVGEDPAFKALKVKQRDYTQLTQQAGSFESTLPDWDQGGNFFCRVQGSPAEFPQPAKQSVSYF